MLQVFRVMNDSKPVNPARLGKKFKVFAEYTPNELAALVGGDTKLQVGVKFLKQVRTAQLLAKNPL